MKLCASGYYDNTSEFTDLLFTIIQRDLFASYLFALELRGKLY